MLPSDLSAAGLARLRVDEVCRGISPGKLDDARLLVTELVANALQHGEGTVVLVAVLDGEGVRVCVEDDGSDMPVVLEPASLLEHGAGLRLVDAIADEWGVAAREDGQPGKRVWFTLR